MKYPHTENRLLWADDLRAIATVSVIFLHVSAVVVMQYGKVSNSVWWAANIYDSAVRFCVPVFVMLTGALILPKDYELGDFLKKRLTRIILPFVFWSFVYIVWKLVIQTLWAERLPLNGILDWSVSLIQDGVSYHFWYIYMIIFLYLLIPVIGKWVRNWDEKRIVGLVFIWAFALILTQPGLFDFKINVDLKYFIGFIGYLVLGYYLAFKTFKNRKLISIISVSLISIGIVITAIGTYLIALHHGKFIDSLYQYFSPSVLITSVGVFLFFVNYGEDSLNRKTRNRKASIIREIIARYSFGIYLIHVLVLDFLNIVGINFNLINPVLGIPLITIMCLLLSVAIVYMVNRLPFGKHISG